jgi:hypothetical protein
MCQSSVGQYIASDTKSVDAIALIIVDGLSYGDWIRSGYSAQPVYVDCPTITECGYPNVVYGGQKNNSVASLLHQRGYTHRRAFTYWEKSQSKLTNRLHDAFSPNDVIGDIEDFQDIIKNIQQDPLPDDQQSYLQITLTGPERVAHRHKEDPDIQNEVNIVQSKIDELYELMCEQVDNPRVYAVADHGMIWRMENTELHALSGAWDHNKRRHIANPSVELDLPEDKGSYQNWSGDEYFRLDHPYLFHSLRSNEPGTHGGYSFEESIVPLISRPN